MVRAKHRGRPDAPTRPLHLPHRVPRGERRARLEFGADVSAVLNALEPAAQTDRFIHRQCLVKIAMVELVSKWLYPKGRPLDREAIDQRQGGSSPGGNR
jgi:hypothetical protein